MRPTGIVLIAIYHFLAAAFLVFAAIALAVGGSVLGAMFAAGKSIPLGGMGFFVGVVGAAFTLVFAVVAALAGYGVWTLREWGRILCIVLAGISLLFSLPGLLFMGLHFGFFLGGYRLIKLAINIAIIWYLIQPQIRSLFQRGAPVLP
ncbi:MAG: hypothetical protein WCC92_18395 [Candidatus Korobacteraceae bacterium]